MKRDDEKLREVAGKLATAAAIKKSDRAWSDAYWGAQEVAFVSQDDEKLREQADEKAKEVALEAANEAAKEAYQEAYEEAFDSELERLVEQTKRANRRHHPTRLRFPK